MVEPLVFDVANDPAVAAKSRFLRIGRIRVMNRDFQYSPIADILRAFSRFPQLCALEAPHADV